MSRTTIFPAQCGIRIISQLSEYEHLDYQINALERAFKNCNNGAGIAMVLISDITEGYHNNRWANAKNVAKRISSRVNPNTGNQITLWAIFPEHLEKLKELRNGKVKGKKSLSSAPW